MKFRRELSREKTHPQMTQISQMDNASQKRFSATICEICG